MKTPTLRFCVDENHFEKELFKVDDITITMRYPCPSFLNHKTKMTGNCSLFKFAQNSAAEKHLIRSQCKYSVFKFLGRSLEGAGSLCLTDQNKLENRRRCVIIYDYKVARAIFSHKPFTEEDILTSQVIQIYRISVRILFLHIFIQGIIDDFLVLT